MCGKNKKVKQDAFLCIILLVHMHVLKIFVLIMKEDFLSQDHYLLL